MKLGTTNAEIISNGDKINLMLDDIANAIDHFKNQMASGDCLVDIINYSKFHIIGESAGGHLALMYAYTRANPSYIKSVTSLYAPTNMVQFSNWISSPSSSNMYTCSTGYVPASVSLDIKCLNFYAKATSKHMPFFWMVDESIILLTSNHFTTTCKTLNSNESVYPGINLVKGLLGKISPTTVDLESISPVHQTNIGIIPTFVAHGNNDFIVPYNQSSQDLNTNLAINGGVTIQNPVCQLTSMPTPNPSKKHLIRRYDGVSHGFVVGSINTGFGTAMFDRLRSDILFWISSN